MSEISTSFVVIAVILGTIVVGTFVGNFFVITAILVDKNLQTTANQLVLSLAVADLMVACLVMPLGAYNDIHQGWYLGKEVCEFWTSADVLCCTASILNLLAIALDRYWAVTSVDYIYRRTRRRVNMMILYAWTVGAIVSLAPMFGWKDPDFAHRVLAEHKCMVSQDVAYQIFATISTFYAPLVLLLALYWRIFQVARKRIRRKPGQRQPATAAEAPPTKGTLTCVSGQLASASSALALASYAHVVGPAVGAPLLASGASSNIGSGGGSGNGEMLSPSQQLRNGVGQKYGGPVVIGRVCRKVGPRERRASERKRRQSSGATTSNWQLLVSGKNSRVPASERALPFVSTVFAAHNESLATATNPLELTNTAQPPTKTTGDNSADEQRKPEAAQTLLAATNASSNYESNPPATADAVFEQSGEQKRTLKRRKSSLLLLAGRALLERRLSKATASASRTTWRQLGTPSVTSTPGQQQQQQQRQRTQANRQPIGDRLPLVGAGAVSVAAAGASVCRNRPDGRLPLASEQQRQQHQRQRENRRLQRGACLYGKSVATCGGYENCNSTVFSVESSAQKTDDNKSSEPRVCALGSSLSAPASVQAQPQQRRRRATSRSALVMVTKRRGRVAPAASADIGEHCALGGRPMMMLNEEATPATKFSNPITGIGDESGAGQLLFAEARRSVSGQTCCCCCESCSQVLCAGQFGEQGNGANCCSSGACGADSDDYANASAIGVSTCGERSQINHEPPTVDHRLARQTVGAYLVRQQAFWMKADKRQDKDSSPEATSAVAVAAATTTAAGVAAAKTRSREAGVARTAADSAEAGAQEGAAATALEMDGAGWPLERAGKTGYIGGHKGRGASKSIGTPAEEASSGERVLSAAAPADVGCEWSATTDSASITSASALVSVSASAAAASGSAECGSGSATAFSTSSGSSASSSSLASSASPFSSSSSPSLPLDGYMIESAPDFCANLQHRFFKLFHAATDSGHHERAGGARGELSQYGDREEEEEEEEEEVEPAEEDEQSDTSSFSASFPPPIELSRAKPGRRRSRRSERGVFTRTTAFASPTTDTTGTTNTTAKATPAATASAKITSADNCVAAANSSNKCEQRQKQTLSPELCSATASVKGGIGCCGCSQIRRGNNNWHAKDYNGTAADYDKDLLASGQNKVAGGASVGTAALAGLASFPSVQVGGFGELAPKHNGISTPVATTMNTPTTQGPDDKLSQPQRVHWRRSNNVTVATATVATVSTIATGGEAPPAIEPRSTLRLHFQQDEQLNLGADDHDGCAAASATIADDANAGASEQVLAATTANNNDNNRSDKSSLGLAGGARFAEPAACPRLSLHPGDDSGIGDQPRSVTTAPTSTSRLMRSLDIKRKFRALGQLVSFVQTSRNFNSSSSGPTSQSGVDEDTESANSCSVGGRFQRNNNLIQQARSLDYCYGDCGDSYSPAPQRDSTNSTKRGAAVLAASQNTTVYGKSTHSHDYGHEYDCDDDEYDYDEGDERDDCDSRHNRVRHNDNSNNNSGDDERMASFFVGGDDDDNDSTQLKRKGQQRQQLQMAAQYSSAPGGDSLSLSASNIVGEGGVALSASSLPATVAAVSGAPVLLQTIPPSSKSNSMSPLPISSAPLNRRVSSLMATTVQVAATTAPQVTLARKPDSTTTTTTAANAAFGTPAGRRENMDIKREKKAAKTLAIITGVFVCCWLPFFLNAIIMPICGPSCTPSDLILSVLLWLGYLNSLLNPIIYTIFSPDFRRAFRRLLCWPQLVSLGARFKATGGAGTGAGSGNSIAKA